MTTTNMERQGEGVAVERDEAQRVRNTLWMSHHYWLQAAKEALQGDSGKLRKHVALSEGMTRETVVDEMSAALATPNEPVGDLPALFEAWWGASPRRNRNLIGYSDKKCLAFDAFTAGTLALAKPSNPSGLQGAEAAEAGLTFAVCGEPIPACDHSFQGWRAHDDGMGGETFCSKCGLGAMAWSLSLDV